MVAVRYRPRNTLTQGRSTGEFRWRPASRFGGLGFRGHGLKRLIATAHDQNRAIADYAKRWAIETLFGCFKSRGFCLESTHLQDSERLSKLLALLTLALCWAFSSGLWLAQLNPLKPKKHGRLPKSIFRLGFDSLRHFIFDLHLNSQAFFNSIKFLSCT